MLDKQNPVTIEQCNSIVENVVAACDDVDKLDDMGYQFLCSCGGFCAHRDIDGFKEHYKTFPQMRHDLYKYEPFVTGFNSWNQKQESLLYHRSKKYIYSKIMAVLRG